MRKFILISLPIMLLIFSCDENHVIPRPNTQIEFGYETINSGNFHTTEMFQNQDSVPSVTLESILVIDVCEFNLSEAKEYCLKNFTIFISSNSDTEYHDNSSDNFWVSGTSGGLSWVDDKAIYTHCFTVHIDISFEIGEEEYDNILHLDPNEDVIEVKYVSNETGENVETLKVYLQ